MSTSSSSARNNILGRIKAALEHPTPLPFPDSEGTSFLYQPPQQDLVVEFAEQFTQLGGKFAFCVSAAELVEQFNNLRLQNKWQNLYCAEEKLQNLLAVENWFEDITTCDASVTTCEFIVARTGSMVLSAAANGRVPSVYAPVHVCVAYTSQLVYDPTEALEGMQQKYGSNLPSSFSFATGPSRTADIEKTLVVGVHGPKEVYCFLVDDSPHPHGGGM